MKAVNLYILTREVDPDIQSEYEYALSCREEKIKLRKEEIDLIRVIVNHFIIRKATPPIFDGWFYSFSIPQIAKEFDLLRIEEDRTINIELKNHYVDKDKIERQLNQNRYYLRHLEKTIYSFTVMKDNNGTSVFKYDDGLIRSSFDEIFSCISNERSFEENDIEKLFDPSCFLVSPINNPEKFLKKDYFLNDQQREVKKAILESQTGQVFGIKGSAGTGKTLLLYDIAFSFSKTRPTCIIHSGILSDGHKYLQIHNDAVTIYAAKDITGEEITVVKGELTTAVKDEICKFDVICVDEAQRLYSDCMDIILKHAEQDNKTCVFSYDFSQSLSWSEIKRDNPKRLNELEGFQEYKLTGRIRTNKEIHSFVEAMMNLRANNKVQCSYKNVDILYANDINESDRILRLYINRGYTFLTVTPSRYVSNMIDRYASVPNSHQVISQEFDSVIVIIDSNFRYDEDGKLDAKEHPNPDYLFTRLFYQIVTRARKKLCIIVMGNHEVLTKLIRIKNYTLNCAGR